MKRRPSTSPIAIVGISCLFPKAKNLEEYWSNIKNRVDGISEIPESHWNPTDYFDEDQKSPDRTYARRGGFIDPFDFNPLEYGIAPKDIEATDTSQLLGMVAAQRALDDSGYGRAGREFDRDRTAVIVGVTGTLELVIPLGARLGHPIWRRALEDAGVDQETAEDVVEKISDSYVGWQENSFPGLLGNVVAGRIASRLDLGGTNCVVDAACASSLSAIHLAALELQAGRTDMVITGGVDTFNDIFMYMCFSKTPALSRSGNARPFDQNADGTIIGEGMGMLVLKRLADAERDGDRVYAVLRGMGSSSDGRGNAVYAPSAKGQAKALRNAYDQAAVTPDTIELVEAHGTGTIVGDATEVTALTEVYRERKDTGTWCAIGSVKSQIGHTKAAAGAAGIIKAALALYHKVLPPTLKVDQPNEKVAPSETPFYVNTEARPWVTRPDHPRRAGVSSFGFGGSNFHCVLEEHSAEKASVDWDGRVQVIALSGADVREITSKLEALPDGSDWGAVEEVAVSSRSQFDSSHECRLLMVVSEGDCDIPKRVSSALRMLDQRAAANAWQTPDGVFFGQGSAAGRLAALFPGQGSQYTGMLRDLACQFPQFLGALDQANRAFWSDGEAKACLSDVIYPAPAFDDETRGAQERALRDTHVAQPALGAVSLGAWKVLETFGVQPDCTGGHSYGELPALHVAGCITDKALHTLSNFRGRMMGAGKGDRGTMLAVDAPLHQVEKILREEALDLVIANRNAPRQSVLSGATGEIDRATVVLKALQIRHKKLPVAAAFHSKLVADARKPFGKALQKVRFRSSSIPVFSNTTGSVYPDNESKTRDLLAGQMAEPVEFVQEIESMYESGVRTFLEIGPGARLCGLVGAILGDRPHVALAVDASAGRRSGSEDLARCLAQLGALGCSVDLSAWQEGFPRVEEVSGRPGFTVPISGANYNDPRSKPLPPRPAKGRRRGAAVPHRVGAEAAVREATATSRRSVSPDPARSSLVTSDAPTPPPSPERDGNQRVHSETKAAAPAQSGSQGTQASSQGSILPADSAEFSAPELEGALRTTQDNLVALQRLQEQTARLHEQFLSGQAQALDTFHSLVAQQQRLYSGEETATADRPSPSPRAATMPAPAKAAPLQRQVAPAPAIEPAAPSRSEDVPASEPSSGGAVTATLLEVVAEKTGYPAEMLSLEMELDSDLGIDSIKRVEILSGLQERLPHAPVVKPDQLGTLRTLAQVVAFLEPAGERVESVPSRPAASMAPAPFDPAGDMATTEVLLAVVAEKTGYPAEMLSLDMQLDADLGIDSIKRVEILSALQERLPNAPAVQPDQLASLGSLQEIVTFLAPGSAVAAAPAQPVVDGATSDEVARVLLSVVAEKTGYPAEMLDLDMQLDADLGIDSIKRVEILSALQEQLPNAPVVQPDQLGSLGSLRQVVDFLSAGANSVDAAPAGGATSADASQVGETLCAIVAEKTGYPVEMLDLDMQLDADLGIDSIKRVEILSALQEQLPEAPVVQPEQLGSLGSLRQVVEFLSASETSDLGSEMPTESITSGSSVGFDADRVAEVLCAIVAEKTGYPPEMLSLDMQLDSDLGIDSIKRVEILSALQERLPEAPAIQPENLAELGTLEAIVGFLAPGVGATTPTLESQPVPSELQLPTQSSAQEEMSEAPAATICRSVVTAVRLGRPPARRKLELPEGSLFWVTEEGGELSRRVAKRLEAVGHRAELVSATTAVSDSPLPERLGGLVILAPKDPIASAFLSDALFLTQRCAPALRAAGPAGAVLVTLSRIDGSFGFSGMDPLHDSRSGGLAGIAKTAAREWPEVATKALDLSPELDDLDEIARAIVEETLLFGPSEVGIGIGERVTPEITEMSLDPADVDDLPLEWGDVVVLSGGARGVTAACAEALARRKKPTLVLLGRSAEPSPEPAWLASLEEESEIKRALIERAETPEDRKPRNVQAQFRSLLANREMLRSIAAMEGAGARVVYMSVDVTDESAVADTLRSIVERYGPVRGLVHGAGVLADQHLEEKTKEAFDRVYSTKVEGAEALLQSVDSDELRFLVMFSSSTARFGRVGQVDYAIANEVVNKMAQQHARLHPTCRVLAVNWGPWDGGMVTPELARIFEAEGIGLIPLRAGAEYLLDELGSRSERPVEVVILGEAPTDGNSTARESVGVAVPSKLPLAFEQEIDARRIPALQSHVLDGKPVVPLALIAEWLAHGALHPNPGFVFQGIDGLRVLKGIILEGDGPYVVAVHAGQAESVGDHFEVEVELRGNAPGGPSVLHARARIALGNQLAVNTNQAFPPMTLREYALSPTDVYSKQLFHGPHFHTLEEVYGCSAEGIAGRSKQAPAPREWIERPLRQRWVADPLALDAAFQLMILWSLEERGHASLPTSVEEYRQYEREFPADGIRVVARVTRASDHAARADVDFIATDGSLVASMRGYECVIDASLRDAFRRNQLAHESQG